MSKKQHPSRKQFQKPILRSQSSRFRILAIIFSLFVVATTLVWCTNRTEPTRGSAEPTITPALNLATATLTAIPTTTLLNASPNNITVTATTATLQTPLTGVNHAITPVALSPLTATAALPLYTYEIVNVYPHDPNAFTQGLLFDNNILYESTGIYGRSSVRKVDLTTGAVLADYKLPDQIFGEGITIFQDRLYQLSWREHIGIIYDKQTLQPIQKFTYPTEGWGLTHDGLQLILSDGSARLYFLDPQTLTETGTVDVYDDKGPVVQLNELEYIQGEIYANIWQTDRIARIDPQTGKVRAWIDLTGLLPLADRTQTTDVLNGIAYLSDSDRLFVTGKQWPKLFEIKLRPLP